MVLNVTRAQAVLLSQCCCSLGEEPVPPPLGSLGKCPALCLGLVPLAFPGTIRFFFSRGIEPGAVPPDGGRISTDALPLYGGPVSGSFKGPGQVAPWVFGTRCPLSPVVLLICLSPCVASALAMCVSGGLSYLHEQFSESSAEKQLFFPGNSQEPLVCDPCV